MPAADLPLAMLMVFGAAKLLAEVFERLGQPGIIGEILAGVLLGPGVLGLVAPDGLLSHLAELGAMFLLFRVGLEVKAADLMRVGGTAALAATLGVLAPFLLGWLIVRQWGAGHAEAIFVGAAMVATSVGITARVLAAKGLLAERASRVILAAAVIDDVLGLLVLALVSGLAKGRVNAFELGLTAVAAIGFTVLVAAYGARAARRVLRWVCQWTRGEEAQFSFAVVTLFALAVLAVWVGVAAIVGAFLAGMALADSAGRRVRDLAHGATELLVPFFLAGVGLHFVPAALAAPGTMALAVAILLAAVVSKLIGCGAGALALGRRDALRVGLGMVPRGEVGMVVAQTGLSMGIITPPIYGVVVFMAVASTLVAPPLVKWAFREPATEGELLAGAGRPSDGGLHLGRSLLLSRS
jgi:Kef-type K+ transport system membrane component KefB